MITPARECGDNPIKLQAKQFGNDCLDRKSRAGAKQVDIDRVEAQVREQSGGERWIGRDDR